MDAHGGNETSGNVDARTWNRNGRAVGEWRKEVGGWGEGWGGRVGDSERRFPSVCTLIDSDAILP